MKHWVCHRGDLKTLNADDGDIAVALYGLRRVYRLRADEVWVRDRVAEREVQMELRQMDREWAKAPGNTTHEKYYYPPARQSKNK